MNGILIAGIVFFVPVAIIASLIILRPHYFTNELNGQNASILCCLPFFLIAIFLGLGILLLIIGNEKEQNHRLRHY